MKVHKKGFGMQGTGGIRAASSVWYVYMPVEEDRDKYVANCLRTATVSLINENNEVVHKVPVGKLSLQLLKFPTRTDRVGSPVLCANVAVHNKLFVVDVYNFQNEFNSINEHEFRLVKETENGLAEVTLDGEGGRLFLNVDGDLGELYISVSNKDRTGKATIEVAGELNIINSGQTNIISSEAVNLTIQDENEESNEDAEKTTLSATLGRIDGTLTQGFSITIQKDAEDEDEIPTTLKYTIGAGLEYTDEFGNSITANETQLDIISGNGETVNIGTGDEAMVLGNILAQLLKDLITEISITTTSPSGGPILNAATIAAYVAQVDNILSAYSNTQ